MNACTISAPPCPSWCTEHQDGGEGTFFHSTTILKAENIVGLYGDDPITVTVEIQAYDGPGVTDKAPHVYLSSDELTTTGSLNLTSPEQISLLRPGPSDH